MNVLLTGANGYIGTRLLPKLAEAGHTVYALVRSKQRIVIPPQIASHVHIIEGDLLNPDSLRSIPNQIDAAYYLVHSMGQSASEFTDLEAKSAQNFRDRIQETRAKQIIYLSGIANDPHLSRHLSSRKHVDSLLREGKVPVTTLMAGIIIGSGSASFEIIRDLVEKLPVMIAPRWVNNLVQPIAIADVIDYLLLVLGNSRCIGQEFEIGGPDVMSYKQILLEFARIRGLKRWIINVPVLTPKLSSYWLYFVTSASFSLARSLVESLKNNAICYESRIQSILPKKLKTFEEAVRRAIELIEEDKVPSSWKDAMTYSTLNPDLSVYVQIPRYGILTDHREIPFSHSAVDVQKKVWSLGGDKGWLTVNWAWAVRGFFDKVFGGVGLRRGRTHPTRLRIGDSLDFWRVIVADESKHRLLLYAEMKLPGEAWLEYVITPNQTGLGGTLIQTATFRPKGLWGRFYWYSLYPVHQWIFRSLVRALASEPLPKRQSLN